MTVALRALHLSKTYTRGAAPGAYGSLRESLMRGLGSPLRWLRGDAGQPFLALDDVSFEVPAGQAVGLIGRNGAGKSTLLRLLSRITAPSAGELRLRGRVASLLEIGTGFHPELTGRENIFLNGAVLGMRRAEIRASFDEIVSFADIGAFLDTPVKRYSSGMHVRLAFAVAAHLRAEILLLDEVLAVGDAAFQKKCLGKVRDVAENGRTVVFVSHNMAAVGRLCPRALLLQGGRLIDDGPSHRVIASYLGGQTGQSPASVSYGPAGVGDERARLLAGRVRGEGGAGGAVDIRRPVTVEIDYALRGEGRAVHPCVALYGESGDCLLFSSAALSAGDGRPAGSYRAAVTIPGNFLAEGLFSIDLALGTHTPETWHAYESGALSLHVHDPAEGDSVRADYGGAWPGAVRPALPWEVSSRDD